jgi:hypothetical protein
MTGKNKKILALSIDCGIIILAFLIPIIADLMMTVIPTCIFARMGILCPTCGATRCMRAFFTGDFGAAFSYNQMVFIMIFYVAALLVIGNLAAFTKWRAPKRIFKLGTHYITVIVIAGIYAVFGILRNFI